MNRKIAAFTMVIGGTVFALLSGPNGPLGRGWRPMPMQPEPTHSQLSALIASGIIEAIGFGAAVALLLLGRPLIARITATPRRTTVAWLSAVWLLGSWWPHTALHMHSGVKASALAPIELTFHAGSILAFAIFLWAVISASSATTP
jgi:hypothetical protein